MSELRHDPLQNRWVIIAQERSSRPSDFTGQQVVSDPKFCPFCPGNEDKTPPEIVALREPGSAADAPGWSVRIIPNKYPALKIEGELDRRAFGIYDRLNGIGAHEVVVESPDHNAHPSEISAQQTFRILQMWRSRIVDLNRDSRFKYVMVFKNHGQEAGASLMHPHSQIIALPILPSQLENALRNAREHFLKKERPLLGDIIRQEISEGHRVVYHEDGLLAWCPYASRFPFEIKVAPLRPMHCFTLTSDEELMVLANVLRRVTGLLRRALNDPPFNIVLYNSPNLNHRRLHPSTFETLELEWTWYLSILPRINEVAGFEWGTGFYINPTAPEEAAQYLRDLQYT